MQRRIDNLQFLGLLDGFRIHGEREQQIKICFIHILAHHFNQFRFGGPFNLFHGRDFVHLFDDIHIVWRHQLPAILPIDLVSIVFFRVV